jgi:hypothetical protein
VRWCPLRRNATLDIKEFPSSTLFGAVAFPFRDGSQLEVRSSRMQSSALKGVFRSRASGGPVRHTAAKTYRGAADDASKGSKGKRPDR